MLFYCYIVLTCPWLTCSLPPASLDQHSVVVQPRMATQGDLAQSQTVQVVQFMCDEPHQQVNQNQDSTHNPHHHVTHGTA